MSTALSKGNSLKVCHYVPHGAVPDIRGFAPAIVAQNFAKHLKEDTYIISAFENYSKSHEGSEYGDVFRIRQGFLYRRLFTKITRLDPYPLHVRAAKIVKQNPVDIFHAHQLEFPVEEFRKMVGSNTKIVVHAHVTRTFDPRWGVADAYVSVSEYVRKRLIDRGFDEKLIHVIPNGVDIEFFSPINEDEKHNLRQKYNLSSSQKVVSFVGRKQEIKGYDIFLSVADAMLKNGSDLFFMAVGPEPKDARNEPTYKHRQKLRKQLLRLGRYIELDALPHESISDVFRLSDAMLMPSVAETQGMAIVEAMSCGCPVISTCSSAIIESIDDGIDGFLIKNRGDISEIVSLLGVAIQSGDNIAPFARKKILDKFAWGKVGADLKTVYERLLS